MATTKKTKKSGSSTSSSRSGAALSAKEKSKAKLVAPKVTNSAKSKPKVDGASVKIPAKAVKSKSAATPQKASDTAKKVKSAQKPSSMKKTPANNKREISKSEPAKAKKIDSYTKPDAEKPGIGAKAVPQKRASKKSAAEVIAELLKQKHGNKPHKAPESVERQEKSAGRPSAGIYFSLEDVDNFLKNKNSAKSDDKYSTSSQSGAEKRKVSKRADEPFSAPVPKKALAPASIADILGFNPIEQSRTVFEEKDVPQKWKKYYKLLIEIKDRVQNGTSNKVDMVSSDNGELSHENSNQGMDVADIGSKNFERDMALNLMSTEQNIISEVNAAIERMRNGTYGVCEVTGKAIPESRLLAIPFARCTIEGQRQKESELRRMKSGAKREQFGVDMQEDFSSGELSDEEE